MFIYSGEEARACEHLPSCCSHQHVCSDLHTCGDPSACFKVSSSHDDVARRRFPQLLHSSSFTSLLSHVLLLCCGYLLFLFPLSAPLKAPGRPSASSLLLSFPLFHFVNDQLARLQQTQGTVASSHGCGGVGGASRGHRFRISLRLSAHSLLSSKRLSVHRVIWFNCGSGLIVGGLLLGPWPTLVDT